MVAQSNLLREEGLEIHYGTYVLDKSALYIMRRLSLVKGVERRHVESSFQCPAGANLYRVYQFALAWHTDEILSWQAQAYRAPLALSKKYQSYCHTVKIRYLHIFQCFRGYTILWRLAVAWFVVPCTAPARPPYFEEGTK